MLHKSLYLTFSRYSIIFLLLIALSSCSLRVIYNYLDWILPWYLDDYVTLTDKQEEFFYKSVVDFHSWHRSNALPEYVLFLGSLKDAQQQPMSKEQVIVFFEDIEELLKDLLVESMDDLIELAQQLTDNQIRQIDEALKDEIQDLQRKYGDKTDEELRQFWQEKMQENFSEWVGGINEEQRLLIESWGDQRINSTTKWLQHRQIWREAFIELLNRRAEDNFSEEISVFLLQPQNTFTLDYKETIAVNRSIFAQLIADLSAVLTSEQRIHLQAELDEIIADLTYLNEQGD